MKAVYEAVICGRLHRGVGRMCDAATVQPHEVMCGCDFRSSRPVRVSQERGR